MDVVAVKSAALTKIPVRSGRNAAGGLI